jgi:ribosomal protein L31E
MAISVKEAVNKIELHYFFADTSHSMNALIRNKCELNLLGILKEIASVLGARVQVESEAYTEGGLVERFVLRSKGEYTKSLMAAIFHYVLPLEVDIEKVVNEENKEETKRAIEKIRRELKEHEKDEDSKVDMDNAAALFKNNLKIIKLKSNFYRQITNCEKSTKLAVQQLKDDNTPSGKPNTISRKKFDTYMLVADTLKPETDEKAVIEIISPVLKVGNYKWKGIYLATGRTINFAMKDNEFKNEVINTGTLFKNGTRIECTMESTRKMSEFGEVTVTGYSVLLVSRKLDDEASVDIAHAKPAKKKKEVELKQLDLFGGF